MKSIIGHLLAVKGERENTKVDECFRELSRKEKDTEKPH